MQRESLYKQKGRLSVAQHTKNAIRRGFMELLNQKPFDKISVVDVARYCEINRNTFYYYYEDIFALVEDVLEQEREKIHEKFEGCKNWESAYLACTGFVQKNKRAVSHLVNSANRDRLERYFYRSTLEAMTAVVRQEASGLSVSEADIESIAVFYASALIGLEMGWILGGMKESAMDYIGNMARLFDGTLRMTLERASRCA